MTTRKILIIQRYIEGKSFKFFTLKLYGSNTTHEVFSIQKVWVENDPRSIFLIKYGSNSTHEVQCGGVVLKRRKNNLTT